MPDNVADIMYDKLAEEYGATDATSSRLHLADLLALWRADGGVSTGEPFDSRAWAYWNSLSFGPASYLEAVLADSPTGYWPLTDASGLPQDASGNGNHATAVAVTAYQNTVVRPGGAAGIQLFDGNTYVIFPQATLDYSADFTMEAWVHVASDDHPSNVSIFSKHDDDFNPHCGIYHTNDIDNGYFYGAARPPGTGEYVTTDTVTADEDLTRYVVMTAAGDIFSLYIDGVLDEAVEFTDARTNTTDANSLRIAANNGGFHSVMSGHYSDVAVYDHALSAVRITAHWDAKDLA